MLLLPHITRDEPSFWSRASSRALRPISNASRRIASAWKPGPGACAAPTPASAVPASRPTEPQCTGEAGSASFAVDVSWLVPFAAGNFLYIGASDLVPEIRHHPSLGKSLLHLAAFAAGLGVLFAARVWLDA